MTEQQFQSEMNRAETQCRVTPAGKTKMKTYEIHEYSSDYGQAKLLETIKAADARNALQIADIPLAAKSWPFFFNDQQDVPGGYVANPEDDASMYSADEVDNV